MSNKLTSDQPSAPHSCRHCGGSGVEPPPIDIQFSRSGSTRGELQALSEKSGVSAPMISSVLSGRRAPSAATLVALAGALESWMGEPVSVERVIRIPQVWKRVEGEVGRRK